MFCDGVIISNLLGILYLIVEENFGESSKGKGVKIDGNRDEFFEILKVIYVVFVKYLNFLFFL